MNCTALSSANRISPCSPRESTSPGAVTSHAYTAGPSGTASSTSVSLTSLSVTSYVRSTPSNTSG